MWAAQFVKYEQPGTWLNSGGLGTMGFAVPAAMGAKVGRPDATVWAIDGDGCFQMTNQELATCAINDIPIKVAIINNSSLGMVRQWQTLFYNERYSNTDLHSARIPDFVKLAEAYGCEGLRCETADDVDATIDKAMAINDRPVVDRLRRPQGRDGLADGCGRHEQRRHQVRARHGARLGQGRTLMTRHTLSVLVEDQPGVLARIASLFSRRGFNIESLAVGPTEHDGMSRMTIAVNVDDLPLEQVTKQLNKLINVLKIVELDPSTAIQRELILVKVRADCRDALAGARDRAALPGQGCRRVAGRGGHRGHRQRRQARGIAACARAVRRQGARPVRHGGDGPRPPLHHRPHAAGGRPARLTPRACQAHVLGRFSLPHP